MKHTLELLSLLILIQVWMNKSISDTCTIQTIIRSGRKENVTFQCLMCSISLNPDNDGQSCSSFVGSISQCIKACSCNKHNSNTSTCSINGLVLLNDINGHQCQNGSSKLLCPPSTVMVYPTSTTGKSSIPCFLINSTTTSLEFATKEVTTAFETSVVYTTVTVMVQPSNIGPAESMAMSPSCHKITVALGSVAGMFMVMIAMVTAGYILIWWNTEKKRRIKIDSEQTSFPNTRTIINTLSCTDKTMRRFNNLLYYEDGPDELSPPPATGVDPSPVAQPSDVEPAYEAIPPPGMKTKRSFEMVGSISHHEANGDKQMQAYGSMLVGVASLEGCGQGVLELSQVGLENEDIENHYHLLGSEELDRQRGQELRGEDIENHYHLLDSEQEDEKVSHIVMKDRSHRHILEQNKSTNQEKSDVGTIESDYYLVGSVEEAAEQERVESVYQVLEMPGHDDNDYEDPDEGELFRDYDERRREREIERSSREARACEVPVTS